MHTRLPDESAISLAPWAFTQILEALSVPPSALQLDPFADAESARAPRWYSLYLAPGSAGVDGFLQRWINAQGDKPLMTWVHGPWHLMGKIIQKSSQERTDCILVAPAWDRPWTSVLSRLPLVATHSLRTKKDSTGRNKRTLVRGSRASDETPHHTVTFAIKDYLIRWPASSG